MRRLKEIIRSQTSECQQSCSSDVPHPNHHQTVIRDSLQPFRVMYHVLSRLTTRATSRHSLCYAKNQMVMDFNNFCTDQLVVEHNKRDKEFFVKMGTEKAVLNYASIGKGIVDMHHTDVPVAFRGKGVAAKLAQTAFDYAVSQDLKMRVSCTYLQKYLKDNPDERYLKQLIQ